MEGKGTLLIEISRLCKSFNDEPVLNEINLSINEGSFLTIIGRSGCGKTTLLRCIKGLEQFDSGSIRLNGVIIERKAGPIRKKSDPNHIKPIDSAKKSFSWNSPEVQKDQEIIKLRNSVGMLFQGVNLFSHLSVMDNVSKAPIIVKKIPKKQAEEIAFEFLKKVGMEAFVDKMPYQLSGGQAQRVAIARALAMSPKVMLYDEPTSALDPELVGEVTQVMRKLHSEGMTQIVVSHSMHFAQKASDLIAYIENGEIIEVSTPEEMFIKPKDTRTAQYLSLLEE